MSWDRYTLSKCVNSILKCVEFLLSRISAMICSSSALSCIQEYTMLGNSPQSRSSYVSGSSLDILSSIKVPEFPELLVLEDCQQEYACTATSPCILYILLTQTAIFGSLCIFPSVVNRTSFWTKFFCAKKSRNTFSCLPLLLPIICAAIVTLGICPWNWQYYMSGSCPNDIPRILCLVFQNFHGQKFISGDLCIFAQFHNFTSLVSQLHNFFLHFWMYHHRKFNRHG